MKNSNKTNSANDFDFSVDDIQSESTTVQKQDEERTTTKQYSNSAQTKPQIPSDSAPFIVLCGPPASGKSMVLKSLASYLYHSELGYTISANATLLNTAKYQEDCEYFNSIISDPDTRMPNTVDYLMADIVDKNGNVVAHFLEAPGEDFFSLKDTEKEPNIQFKSYLDKVAQITPEKQRKVIYVILLDLDSSTSFRNSQSLRDKYEKKMVKLYNRYVLHHPSRIVLLYNKVDLPQNGLWANSNGCSNPSAVIADAKQNYPNLFFKKRFLFWDIENYSFLPFCTGSYPDDGSSYTASGPAYPSSLWKEIIKLW